MNFRTARLVGFLSALVVAAFALLLYLKPYLQETSRLAGIPDSERRAMYERTLADLQACAALGDSAPESHCSHQASFVLRFEECDRGCRALAGSIGRGPTR